MPNSPAHGKIASAPPGGEQRQVSDLIVRAREPGDWEQVAELKELPKVRWGTLSLPFTSKEQWRKTMEAPPDGMTGIVAALKGRIVGSADIQQRKGRRRHVGDVGVFVHDDFQQRGVGTALMAALIDVADNWLDLKRLELIVYVDNEPAIRLYQKFDFKVEGTLCGHTFRDGKYVDAFFMARLKPGWRAR